MTTADPKIIDILSKKACSDAKPLVSLEYFPPRTEEGVKVSFALGFSLFRLVWSVAYHIIEWKMWKRAATCAVYCSGLHRSQLYYLL
jgi:hypothetical protein